MKTSAKSRKESKVKPRLMQRFSLPASGTLKGIAAAAAAIVVSCLFYLAVSAASSVLRISTVGLTGNEHITDEEIRHIAGLRPDENLFRISSKKVHAKLMESPWIQSAAVRKEYPSSLQIKISETEPFALLDMKGKMFLVDDRGRLLEELRENSVPFLPVILSDPYNEKEAFLEAINLARTIASMGFLGRKERIEIIAHRPNEISANLDGMVVKVGAGEHEDKLARLLETEEEIKKKNIPVAYIDLRFSKKVIVKPVNEVIR
jgi:cell division protein FtsQ